MTKERSKFDDPGEPRLDVVGTFHVDTHGNPVPDEPSPPTTAGSPASSLPVTQPPSLSEAWQAISAKRRRCPSCGGRLAEYRAVPEFDRCEECGDEWPVDES